MRSEVSNCSKLSQEFQATCKLLPLSLSLCVVTVAKLAAAPLAPCIPAKPLLPRCRSRAFSSSPPRYLPCVLAAVAQTTPALPARIRARHCSPPWPPPPLLSSSPFLHPTPNQTNPAAGFTSPPGSSPTFSPPLTTAGTPPQRHSTATGRRPPWNRRHGPPTRAPRPPTGPRRAPLAPPPLPRRQRALPWPESPFSFLPCSVFATRDPRQQ